MNDGGVNGDGDNHDWNSILINLIGLMIMMKLWWKEIENNSNDRDSLFIEANLRF